MTAVRIDRSGFSLVEVILAMLILAVGVLAMGASTGFIMNQVNAASLRTERAVSVREATELLRTVPWDDLESECADLFPIASNGFSVDCVFVTTRLQLKDLQIITDGPGYAGGRIQTGVKDTLMITRAQPAS